jgi:signal transduction histidine kinase
MMTGQEQTGASPPKGEIPGEVLVRGHCDGHDRLVSADALLSALQMRCGGTIPGDIAIPALLDLVSKARRFGLKLARPLIAQDAEDTIRAWAEIEPGEDGNCAIVLRHWQATPLALEDQSATLARHLQTERVAAELTARLDARQSVLAVESDAPDLAALAAAMRAGAGRPWTNFVTIPGDSHRQPLHWRLLDGAAIAVPGSARAWRVALLPTGAAGSAPTGFELLLNSDQPADPPMRETIETPADDRMLGRDLAPVLRRPIARIIANAETIRLRLAGPLGEDYASYAADIAVSGQHLLELIDDLADLEVIESPDFRAASDPIDLADVARRAAGILAMRAREKRIALAVPAADARVPARAEFRRVLQVLINLLTNAIRYSPEGSTVTVELGGELGNANGRACVVVRDEGPGLAAEQRERVFDKFERLGRTGDGGSGLGLYISRRLARAMGGDLWADGAPGGGARFVLEVPAA